MKSHEIYTSNMLRARLKPFGVYIRVQKIKTLIPMKYYPDTWWIRQYDVRYKITCYLGTQTSRGIYLKSHRMPKHLTSYQREYWQPMLDVLTDFQYRTVKSKTDNTKCNIVLPSGVYPPLTIEHYNPKIINEVILKAMLKRKGFSFKVIEFQGGYLGITFKGGKLIPRYINNSIEFAFWREAVEILRRVQCRVRMKNGVRLDLRTPFVYEN